MYNIQFASSFSFILSFHEEKGKKNWNRHEFLPHKRILLSAIVCFSRGIFFFIDFLSCMHSLEDSLTPFLFHKYGTVIEAFILCDVKSYHNIHIFKLLKLHKKCFHVNSKYEKFSPCLPFTLFRDKFSSLKTNEIRQKVSLECKVFLFLSSPPRWWRNTLFSAGVYSLQLETYFSPFHSVFSFYSFLKNC